MRATQRLTSEQRARLERLREQGVLTQRQLNAVLDELDSRRDESARAGLWEVLGYIGGALVLGGAFLLVGMSWDDLSRGAQAAVLVAVTLVLVGAAVTISGTPRNVLGLAEQQPSPRARIVSVLFALAALTTAMAVGTGFAGDESLPAAVAGLIVALLAYIAVRGVILLLGSAAFSVAVVASAVHEWFDRTTVPMSTGLMVLGVAWTALAVSGFLRQRQTALGCGIVIALCGAQYAVSSEQPWWGYGLTLLIGLLCFAAYLFEQAVVLLVFGVLGVTLSVPEALWDWTNGALGAPLTVLLVGIVFLCSAGIGYRLRKRKANRH